ncbi:ATPase, T2SS/T4P/T4SS family, partial [Pseudomonas alcaligenes]
MSTDTHAALAAPAEPPLRPLPFAFAKRHGVLLREPFGQAQLQVRRGASLTAVQEAQRFAGRVLPLHWLEPEAFEQELTLAYQRDSSEVRQMAEGLGAELDLASLAELTPESGDLLEQEDDAPIIRLINAILSEAIKAGASDIHLETFEKRLVVRFRVDGILREVIEPRRELAALLVSRVKV